MEGYLFTVPHPYAGLMTEMCDSVNCAIPPPLWLFLSFISDDDVPYIYSTDVFSLFFCVSIYLLVNYILWKIGKKAY